MGTLLVHILVVYTVRICKYDYNTIISTGERDELFGVANTEDFLLIQSCARTVSLPHAPNRHFIRISNQSFGIRASLFTRRIGVPARTLKNWVHMRGVGTPPPPRSQKRGVGMSLGWEPHDAES